MKLLVALTRCAALFWLLVAASYPSSPLAGQDAVEPFPRTDAVELARRIDALIEESLREQSVEPGPLCDDATFVRRLTLDLTGKNPLPFEVVEFMRDDDRHKRGALIDRLLESPASAVHLANTWSAWLLPEMQAVGPPPMAGGLQAWLRNRFADNLRYDRLVADLLVASGPAESGPGEFFLSLEGKPEKIAAKTARVFLGVQLDCAECHDHPFDHWKQRDFWSFAAYFAQLSAGGMSAPGRKPAVSDLEEGEVQLPNSDEVIAPRPLVATGLSGLASGTRRQQLTLWLTARENPYLARAAVNRCWSLLFGRGLIEPIDDMRAMEMASHPELLRELAEAFAASGYDLRQLLRGLAGSHAYQRASRRVTEDLSEPNPPASHYAWMPVKPLTALQLAACYQQVARNVAGPDRAAQVEGLARQLGKLRGEGSTATLGIVQALVTLHSEGLDEVHQDGTSRLLQALSAPHLDDRQRIEWLFLSTLCRPPRPGELAAITAMLPQPAEADKDNAAAQGDEADKAEASQWQADLLWALVNSTEFAMTP